MYRNADEIEKLEKIKADSDQEMAMVLQQLKNLVRIPGLDAAGARRA